LSRTEIVTSSVWGSISTRTSPGAPGRDGHDRIPHQVQENVLEDRRIGGPLEFAILDDQRDRTGADQLPGMGCNPSGQLAPLDYGRRGHGISCDFGALLVPQCDLPACRPLVILTLHRSYPENAEVGSFELKCDVAQLSISFNLKHNCIPALEVRHPVPKGRDGRECERIDGLNDIPLL